jgi:hypothetical protein
MRKLFISWAFLITTFLIIILQVCQIHSDFLQPTLNILFIWGFLGLVVINILLFVFPLCKGLIGVKLDKSKTGSDAKRNCMAQEELKPIIDGETVGEGKLPRWAIVGIEISIGLLVGSIIGVAIRVAVTSYI